MDRRKKVTGTWHGTFTFGTAERTPPPDPVVFTLVLEQGWFGRITGTVTENGPGSMPGTGVVKGSFSFPYIRFTKCMPVCCVLKQNGEVVTLREFLRAQGHDDARDLPHPPVFYEGELSGPNLAHGTWTVEASSIALGNGRAIQVPEARGDWSAVCSER